MAESALFSPIRIGRLELPGRLAKSATVEAMCDEKGFVTDDLIGFYEHLARGGTPLIITGAAYFDYYSRGSLRQIGLDHDDKIPHLERLVAAVHRHHSKIFAQIYHTGRQVLPQAVGRGDNLAPSRVLEPDFMMWPRAMTRDEIRQAVDGFADGAARCQRAGFDGVQIHAAHGYLISSFLTPHTNRRTDDYGGSFDNRLRFLLEVYRATRERVGADYPVIVKLNGSDDLPLRRGLETPELVRIAQRLEDEGIDAVEVSAGHYESGMTSNRGRWTGFFRTAVTVGAARLLPWYKRWPVLVMAPLFDSYYALVSSYREGFNLPYARQFKEALEIPVICVGGFIHREVMERALQDGECDVISCARPLLADPYLYRHLREGVRGPECTFCNACYARANALPVDCYDPEVRTEKRRMLAAEG